MKAKVLLLAAGLALFVNTSYGQDISGDWQGTLEVAQRKLLIIVSIARLPEGWSARLYSPEGGIDVGLSTRFDSVTLQGQDLRLTVTTAQARYEGKLSADGNSIEG